MLNAIDCSNYTGALSAEALAAWKALGIRYVIVQTVAPPAGYPIEVDKQQAQAIIDAGLALGVYVFYWSGAPQIAHANAARFAGYGFPVERWWGDFEDTAPYAPQQREAEITDLLVYLDTLGGKRPAGAYSGKWWTDGYLPTGSQVFAGRALWVSAYDGVDTLDAPALCGGTVVMHQYKGTSTVAGVGNVDLNVADEAEFTDSEPPVPAPTPEPPDPTVRETPDDYPFPDWRQSAIAYRGAMDFLGQQVETLEAQIVPLADLQAQLAKAKAALAQETAASRTQTANLTAQLKQTVATLDAAVLARNVALTKIAKAKAALV